MHYPRVKLKNTQIPEGNFMQIEFFSTESKFLVYTKFFKFLLKSFISTSAPSGQKKLPSGQVIYSNKFIQ